MNIRRKRQQNAWSKLTTEIYYSLRDAQLERMEAYAIGYPSMEKTFFAEIEKRVTFKDVLIMMKGSTRAAG